MTSNVLRLLGSVLIAVALCAPGLAAVVPQEPGRFDRVVLYDPSSRIGTLAEPPQGLPGYEAERAGWQAFQTRHGGGWQVWLDRRSGTPTLVEGRGIRWMPAESAHGASVSDLEARARAFVAEHTVLFKVQGSELSLNPASGPMDADHWVLVFDRRVAGVPVEDERLIFYVTRGNLVAFGADRWGQVGSVPAAVYGADTAREVLYLHMGILPSDRIELLESGTQVLVPAKADPEADGPYRGEVGRGISFHLAWRFVLRVAGERGTWVGKVDAVTGEVIAFYDDDKYEQVKGGVFPISNDGDCADLGCELASYPMPHADVTIDGTPQTAGDAGDFDCSPGGGTATTTLAGPYVRIGDNCGPVSQSVTCDEDLDLGVSAGTDCSVPAGASAGNTHSARSGFYHLNRIKEKARYWLPGNTWVNQQLFADVNINSNCNAFWDGTINMYKSGGGCRNTGELAGVVNHEYGHGLDENDGGGYDNASETYADVVAILQEHKSCVGRGFTLTGNCSGYGDSCLDCSGIRDHDWDQRQAHTPATPANFIDPNCGGGGGPCGREVHCEAYPPAEAVFDLATRDLPTAGLDPASAWQLAERLFYVSRQGSGGNTHNCSLPNSDGCGAGTWFTKFRNVDDDDGNLNNGTPHAAAIFAAFNRHALACGQAGDASNQNTSSCSALQTPSLTTSAGSNSAILSWTAVPGASNYLVLRTDVGCNYSQNVVATVPAPNTTYTDTDLPNDFAMYYRVQAQGANTACTGAVSSCQSVTPQPFAGSIKLDRSTYGCSSLIRITVRDANVGASTVTAALSSASEPGPETVVLTETPPGSAKFVGTILATSDASSGGDGMLRIAHADTITAQYVDADDGLGGSNLTRQTSAVGDCVFPIITQVVAGNITDVQARITWQTDELSTSVVHWGSLQPPQNTQSDPSSVNAHSVQLGGLQACTVYYYSVESQDRAGNVALADAAGQYFHFETLGNLGNGLQSCHGGRVQIDQSVVSCASALTFQVTDLDLNLSPEAVDTVTINVTSTTESLPEVVTLVETGPNTSRFTGSIPTGSGAPIAGDGLLQTAHADVLTATYNDGDDGTGSPAVSFDTAQADCAPASASAVRVTNLGDDRARVEWTTSEATTGRVDWGPTPALGNVAQDTFLTTSHGLILQPLEECGRIHFRITSTDAYGHTSVFDAAGSPYQFNAYRIPGALFRDDFETSTGWTLEGEWQIAAPQGKGTANPDPGQAFAGSKVLGHDLTGLGAHSGNYEPNTSQRATSPLINATTLVNGELKFRRWLNVSGEAGAVSSIVVKRNNLALPAVWTSSSSSQTGWSYETLNIAGTADGATSLQIVFQQTGGAGPGTRSGWNLDRVIVRSANQPEFDACGGCGGAPSFAGATGAADVAGCADSGILLTWKEAAAWGTGRAGSYSVYRDSSPSFTPSAANRIATGVSGTTYTDAAAPNDTILYYIVRAENDETCSSGPRNGGVTDANVVRVSSRDEVSQPAPGDLGGSLRAVPVNDAHLRLSWTASPTAASYRVYRSQSAQGPFTQVADVVSTFYDDVEQLGNSTSWYYLVRAADTCGNEGP